MAKIGNTKKSNIVEMKKYRKVNKNSIILHTISIALSLIALMKAYGII